MISCLASWNRKQTGWEVSMGDKIRSRWICVLAGNRANGQRSRVAEKGRMIGERGGWENGWDGCAWEGWHPVSPRRASEQRVRGPQRSRGPQSEVG